MAKVFVSYSARDRDYVLQVSNDLKELGHEITVDVDSLSPGQKWQRTLAEGLKTSDVFVVFLSGNALTSPSVLSEIGSARAYSEESERMLVIPVLIDDIPIPSVVQDLLVIQAQNRDVTEVVLRIDAAIASFFGRRVAREEEQVALSVRIEENSSEYITEAIKLLEGLEARNRHFGVAWYIAGFLALVLGVAFALLGVANLVSLGERGWLDFCILAMKSLVVVGLLGACSKYAFTLGKSYVNESLKSADRIHAISFGRFYLRVFGAKANWPEIKEVFQHWNIDRNSSFANLATSEFDPKLLEAMIEMTKALGNRGTEKK